jgi:hypothetical protein
MAGKMRFTGDYEVHVVGKGIFSPGWEGTANEELLENHPHLFERVQPRPKTNKRESEE